MAERAKSQLMWENNPDTPITASNLSRTLDFTSESKFIYFSDELADYEAWADYTINEPWPNLNVWDVSNAHLNKTIYNYYDNQVKRPVINPDTELKEWVDLPSPKNKILKIKANTKISLSYLDVYSNQDVVLSFDFGKQDQMFTIDDILSQAETDLLPEEIYSVYLYYKYSYDEKAAAKILLESDENADFWKQGMESTLSPTGNDVISYRKIGGFRTDESSEIVQNSLWDISTYSKEISVESLKKFDNGSSRRFDATDIYIVDENNYFNTAGSGNMNIEQALNQSRSLVNNLAQNSFTNRKIGFSVKHTFVKPNNLGSYQYIDVNDVSVVITEGIIDVLGSLYKINDDIHLSDPNVGFFINGSETLTFDAFLSSTEEPNRIYPGVWRIFISYDGGLSLRHEDYEDGVPIWSPQYFGWYDVRGNRCIGKFRVKSDAGNYVERYSVTDTFDVSLPSNSMHLHFGTLCPDGLLPADGKWRDATYRDINAYDFNQLPPISEWGNSWYVECPDYTGVIMRGSEFPVAGITGGPYNPLTNSGGADDYSETGGNEEHVHSFPHNHGSGTLNVLPSGQHPGDHEIDWNGGVETVDVNTVADGTGIAVAAGNHEHFATIQGGRHSHTSDNISGLTDSVSGDDANTEAANNWPPYKKIMVCFKP